MENNLKKANEILTQQESEFYCEEHNYKYLSKTIFGIQLAKCPKCEEIRKELEKKTLKAIEEQERYNKKVQEQSYLANYSYLPKRYLNLQLDYNFNNFSKYAQYLKQELKNNLFLVGGVGVGKTAFLSELMKINVNLKPKFLSGTDIALMSVNSFKQLEFLEKYQDTQMLVIDEVQEAFNCENILLLDTLVNNAYNNNAFLVFAGNLQKEDLKLLQQDKFKRIASRLKQNNLRILEFGGEDLR